MADRENDNSGVALLLFDEPSASLDPTAEHGGTFAFSRLTRVKLKLCFRFI